MLICMRTTLNIDDSVMKQLKQEAARTGRTMSELMETAIRRLLKEKEAPQKLPPLPGISIEGALVDVADRNALYEAMEGR
jgi:hypothetical protein